MEWLCYRETFEALFCFYCLLFTAEDSLPWTKAGVRDLNIFRKKSRHIALAICVFIAPWNTICLAPPRISRACCFWGKLDGAGNYLACWRSDATPGKFNSKTAWLYHIQEHKNDEEVLTTAIKCWKYDEMNGCLHLAESRTLLFIDVLTGGAAQVYRRLQDKHGTAKAWLIWRHRTCHGIRGVTMTRNRFWTGLTQHYFCTV